MFAYIIIVIVIAIFVVLASQERGIFFPAMLCMVFFSSFMGLPSRGVGTIGKIYTLEKGITYTVVRVFDEEHDVLAVSKAPPVSLETNKSVGYHISDVLVIHFSMSEREGLEEGDRFLVVEGEKGVDIIHRLK